VNGTENPTILTCDAAFSAYDVRVFAALS